jgi:hypothetical protein
MENVMVLSRSWMAVGIDKDCFTSFATTVVTEVRILLKAANPLDLTTLFNV